MLNISRGWTAHTISLNQKHIKACNWLSMGRFCHAFTNENGWAFCYPRWPLYHPLALPLYLPLKHTKISLLFRWFLLLLCCACNFFVEKSYWIQWKNEMFAHLKCNRITITVKPKHLTGVLADVWYTLFLANYQH